VNILAEFAGERMFSDKEFMKKSSKLISDERRKALTELGTWKNIKAYDSNSNFILLKLLTDKVDASEIFEKLIYKKMLIRDASSFAFLDETYLRFCIQTPEHNKMLLDELKKIVE
ncbi:MAG: aminotransferase class I/II-fold pyridoxal phosphate-dependent enzyme, partial [Clostridia bacterium]|nr:aminotransferase class I/II-fold pyridoxal phosphate-dependent enzyme [Clostridia bacterium]